MAEPISVWSAHAQNWGLVGLPQRPSSEDLAFIFRYATASLSANQTSNACVGVLGVTPELVQGPWPEGVSIEAFDRSEEMIHQHWSPHPSRPSRVHLAFWHDMPIANHRLGVIAADGVTTQFADKAYYSNFFKEMRRVLMPHGSLVMRSFVRHATGSLAEIRTQVHCKAIRQFGTLKWLIAMSLTDTTSLQVPVSKIAEHFDELFPDRDALSTLTGWDRPTLDTMDAYRGSDVVYTFPTLGELITLMAPYFYVEAVSYGMYELSHCCPILHCQPAPHPSDPPK